MASNAYHLQKQRSSLQIIHLCVHLSQLDENLPNGILQFMKLVVIAQRLEHKLVNHPFFFLQMNNNLQIPCLIV